MFSFESLSLAIRSPPSHLLTNVSGYVRRGGVTGVVGASGSGKTLLMRALCGRETAVVATGTVTLNGQLINLRRPNHIGFVPQEDLLIGELTVRETFRLSAELHQSTSGVEIDKSVASVISGLGLDHVADRVIGTTLKRGLSGGEKRRVSVGVELVARPDVICLDEPTSGLDASSAYVVIKSIRQLARDSGGRLCVLLSVHQPNARLLSLFDDLLVLGRGSMVYFGAPSQAAPFFSQLGFPAPRHMTPTDFIVHLVDQRFHTPHTSSNQRLAKAKAKAVTATQVDGESSSNAVNSSNVIHVSPSGVSDSTVATRAHTFDFPTMYHLSTLGQQVRSAIAESQREPSAERLLHPQARYTTTWWRQVAVLTHRFTMVGTRDITLYLLQFALNCFYGFMVGAEFYQLPTRIGSRLQDYTNGIVWLVFVATYLQVFKVYHLMTLKERFHHEHANQSFAPSAWSVSDLLVTSVFSFCTFIPGLLVAYFMMGMPSSAVGYVIFVLFMVVMAAESLMDLLCQFCSYVPSAILLGQGTLVVLCVFAGGAFIKWSSLGFWVWLSECSIYTWSTRGLMIRIFRDVTYECPAALIQPAGQCVFAGLVYPCDADFDTASPVCRVRGPTVLAVSQDVNSDERDEWFQAGILILLLAVFRLLTYLLLRFPWLHLKTRVRHLWTASPLTDTLLKQQAILSTLAARVHVLEHPVSRQSVASSGELEAESSSHVAIEMTAIPAASAAGRSQTWRQSSPCPLRWQHLTLTLRSSGQILVDDLDGYAQPGKVMAIMGPSGAGKTTMLNALSGRAPYAKISGSVQLGSSALSKAHLDYVPQFDLLNPSISISTTFCIMAKLKNVGVDCETRVVELLTILGLASRGDELIGSLSSGDRKRVSIGLGLISNPAVLMLDEPTTGLDSEAALVVVDYCVQVARATGVICVMTIHQPSAGIFAKLDHLLLLSRGKLAYFGPTRDAQAYFEQQGFVVPQHTNPADFFLDLMNAKTMRDVNIERKEDQQGHDEAAAKPLPNWRQQFDNTNSAFKQQQHDSERGETGACVSAEPVRPSELQRLSVLVRSRLLYFWLERSIYVYRLVELILLGIFIGTLFLNLPRSVVKLNELAGAMFFNVWVVLFAAIGATPIFVRDRAIVENEYLNGAYQMGTHVWALFIAALPYHLVTALVYQSIVWFLVGFHDSFEPWVFAVLSTLSLLLLMEALSLLVVEFLPNAMLATTGTMVLLGTFFLFPGFFIKVPDMVRSIAWLSWIVPTKYSLDSQIQNILHQQEYDTGMGTSIAGEDIGTLFFQLDGRNKWADWAVVMTYALGFRALHYLALRWHYRMYSKGKLAEE